jgi:hypothetical protein
MRMYELWRVSPRGEIAVRLEDAGGPVLFPRRCDAEEYARSEAEARLGAARIIPVRVGYA